MSNITIKRAGELLSSIFEILWDKPDGLTAREVLSRIPHITKLTEDELKTITQYQHATLRKDRTHRNNSHCPGGMAGKG